MKKAFISLLVLPLLFACGSSSSNYSVEEFTLSDYENLKIGDSAKWLKEGESELDPVFQCEFENCWVVEIEGLSETIAAIAYENNKIVYKSLTMYGEDVSELSKKLSSITLTQYLDIKGTYKDQNYTIEDVEKKLGQKGYESKRTKEGSKQVFLLNQSLAYFKYENNKLVEVGFYEFAIDTLKNLYDVNKLELNMTLDEVETTLGIKLALDGYGYGDVTYTAKIPGERASIYFTFKDDALTSYEMLTDCTECTLTDASKIDLIKEDMAIKDVEAIVGEGVIFYRNHKTTKVYYKTENSVHLVQYDKGLVERVR